MKKKNVIGHMTASKNSARSWFRKLNLLPRLLCLLLAAFIWLCVGALVNSGKNEIGKNQSITVSETTEG